VFSSVVSLYHGPGQANYNAGSTFTDEYARWAEATYGLPVRVINWGFWGEVGVVATSRHRREMAARGLGSIGVAEGFAVVERVLAHYRVVAQRDAGHRVIDVDGARIVFPDGAWGLVRASNTQPVLVLRAEATTPERRDEILLMLQGLVAEHSR
jgi:hypothetical protein